MKSDFMLRDLIAPFSCATVNPFSMYWSMRAWIAFCVFTWGVHCQWMRCDRCETPTKPASRLVLEPAPMFDMYFQTSATGLYDMWNWLWKIKKRKPEKLVKFTDFFCFNWWGTEWVMPSFPWRAWPDSQQVVNIPDWNRGTRVLWTSIACHFCRNDG